MSETGRLRELLAECRSLLDRNRIAISEHDVKDLAKVRTRLDAALAEPIVLTQPELDRMLAEAKQQGARECPHHRIDAGVMNRAIREAEGKAFVRGAEAAFAAAASCVGSDTALLQTYRSVLESRIRSLSVPEDRP